MRAWKISFLATIVVVLLAHTGPGYSHHSSPDATGWGVKWTWDKLYPDQSGSLYWKAWTVNGTAVPLADQWILADVVLNKWEAPLDYALAGGGYRQFNFIGAPYNGYANAKYARMDNQSQVDWFCSSGDTESDTMACFDWETRVYDNDSQPIRYKVTTASLIYGNHVWSDPVAKFAKHVSHEGGHGMGLGHHPVAPPCETVMSRGECNNQPTADDIVTSLTNLTYFW
jgi:hypothetical protein